MTNKCEACGGCGVLITSWDTLGDPEDGTVFVDTCDACTTNVEPYTFRRCDASRAIAIALETNILLVRDSGYTFKDAIVAPIRHVEALLDGWNKMGKHLADIVLEQKDL